MLSGMSDERASIEPPRGVTPATIAPEHRRVLATLYARHWKEIVAYVARAFGQGPPDPEDAAQSAFAQYAALSEPERILNPRAFLYRSASNFVLDFKRRARTRAKFEVGPEAALIMGGANEFTPERVLSGKERADILERAVMMLKPRQREVLILNRIHAMSYAEISRAKGISETEVRRLVAVAVRACDRALSAADAERTSTALKGKKP